jgi:hypothetical protein
MLESVASVIKAVSDATQNVTGVATCIKSHRRSARLDFRLDTSLIQFHVGLQRCQKKRQ